MIKVKSCIFRDIFSPFLFSGFVRAYRQAAQPIVQFYLRIFAILFNMENTGKNMRYFMVIVP